MKLKVNRHHLAISTPLQHQVGSIESSLRHWADEQLLLLLAQRLSQIHFDQGYTCIKSMEINFQLLLRSGMMPTEFDLWIDQIVDGLLEQLSSGQGEMIRGFDNESDYLAAFCLHLLQYGRAVDWPFEPSFNANLTVADNLLAQFQHKVTLLPEIISRLQQPDAIAAVIKLFDINQSTQLLHYCAKPVHQAVAMSALCLAQQSQFEQVARVLSKLDILQAEHMALVLALVGLYPNSLPLDDSQWQGIDNLVQLVLWLDNQSDVQSIKDLVQGQCVATDLTPAHIRMLYQVSVNAKRSKKLFYTQLHIAAKLLAEVKPQSKVAELLPWFDTMLGDFRFDQSGGEAENTQQQPANSAPSLSTADEQTIAVHPSNQVTADVDNSQSDQTEHNHQHSNQPQAKPSLSQVRQSEQTGHTPQSIVKSTASNQSITNNRLADEDAIDDQQVKQTPLQVSTRPITTLSAADLAAVVLPRTEAINFAGMCLVLAALRRHPAAPLLSMEALWLLCCYAVPKDKRPLAFSDRGLRLMCFGVTPWVDGQVIVERVEQEHNFTQFCSFIRVTEQQQLHVWVLKHLASFMTGFEQSTSDNIIRHFIDFSGKVTVMKKAVYSELHKPPLAIIVSMSPLFNQQSVLAAWPDRPWFIKWKD